MLARMRHYFSFHGQALQQSLSQMMRQPLSTVATWLVLAITLTLPTLFWTAADNLRALSSQWDIRGQLTVYYDSTLPEETINALHGQIHNLEAVADTRFISAEAALNQLQQEEGMQDVLRDLPENPLPAASIVIPRLGQQDTASLTALQAQLQALPGVEQVKVDLQWIQRLKAIFSVIQQVAHLIIALLATAVVFIIANTLRLTMQHQQDEIRILKLVGAPDRFILRPFLYAGLLYGLFSAILAIILSNIVLAMLGLRLHQLLANYGIDWQLDHLSLRETALIIISATLLGWLAARLAVKKQLQAIEPAI
ncbi:MAG: cell division protein FtsX [Legionellaceae bacterium]|nr:cell division protein FtsX [Legionellaceae bacterium]